MNMKKYLKHIAIAAIVVTISSITYNSQKTTFMLSKIALENIEAIANNEIDPECPNGCLAKDGPGCYCRGDYPDLQEANWD